MAQALKEWLPLVIQASKPWMSEVDIEKGTIGLLSIREALGGIRHGIICLTPENPNNPWVLFEAGAIASKVGEETRLYAYLLGGLEGAHVRPPLNIYQYTLPNKSDTLKMLLSLNTVLGTDPVQEHHLKETFEMFWPRLETTLQDLPAVPTKLPEKKSPEEMLAEILELLRNQDRQMESGLLGANISNEASRRLRLYTRLGEETLAESRGYYPHWQPDPADTLLNLGLSSKQPTPQTDPPPVRRKGQS